MIIREIPYSDERHASSVGHLKLLYSNILYDEELNCCFCWSDHGLTGSLDIINRFAHKKKLEAIDVVLTTKDIFDNIAAKVNEAVSNDIIEQVNQLFISAIEKKASDIHITRVDDTAELSFRINGSRTFQSLLEAGLCDELVFVMYNILATTKETTWNRQVAQNANIIFYHNGLPYRFRYAHNPIFSKSGMSFHAVLRVIVPSIPVPCPNLDFLRLSAVEERDVIRMVSQPFGIYIIAGTTGSGKSLTLKTILEWMSVNRYENKGVFLSVEDPVEYEIEGCYQSSVTAADTKGMANAIKSALRRDPDVLMIGEVRDETSATALSTAVESGHYCFTTLHAGNIPSLLSRLVSLGIGSEKLSTPGFIAGLQCQKLIPLLCETCKIETGTGVFIRNTEGCPDCNFNGGAGRQLVCEYLIGDEFYLEDISNGRFDLVLDKWRNRQVLSWNGLGEGFSIKEKVYFLVRTGKVCNHYFEREFGGSDTLNSTIVEFFNVQQKIQ